MQTSSSQVIHTSFIVFCPNSEAFPEVGITGNLASVYGQSVDLAS
jgi:hypothetical protein